MGDFNFDNIRPYTEKEAKDAILRITQQPEFQTILDHIFDKSIHHTLIEKTRKAKNVHEFQKFFMHPLVEKILKETSLGLSTSGFEKLEDHKSHLLIANHRDITLDSSILAKVFIDHNLKTPEVTWGDNLMVSPFVVDFGKINRMITVFREGSPRELLINSKRLSAYIRNKIINGESSVWIAQSKGRTKDGNDKTDVGVLRMLSLEGSEDILTRIKLLNIIPVSISFEWEPCDSLKLKELYISRNKRYEKEPTEDLNSIIGGIFGWKGHVNLSVGDPLNDKISAEFEHMNSKEILQKVAALIDESIYSNYKLWPSNYLAYDLLKNTSRYSEYYTDETKNEMSKRLKSVLKKTGGVIKDLDIPEATKIFYSIYANPVINKMKITSPLEASSAH